MTRFPRTGHHRTNVYGTTFWVSGHSVERYDWERVGSSPGSWLSSSGALSSRSACYVNPNATCPVCGASVFFYQNEYGSRVFFDELGPPWPKHPCTDNGRSGRTVERPEERDAEDVGQIADAVQSLGIEWKRQFVEKYGSKPWRLMILRKTFRIGTTTYFVAEDLEKRDRRI
jgi:hypothetical protein